MDVLYLTPYCPLLPTTNRISDVRFCEGFAQNGCRVTLLAPFTPSAHNADRSDLDSVYGIEHPFDITLMSGGPAEKTASRRQLAQLLAVMGAGYVRELFRRRGGRGRPVVLSRDVNLLLPVLAVNKTLPRRKRPLVVHWAHEIKPDKAQYRWVYRAADGIAGTNSAITEDLQALCGVPAHNTHVTLNPIASRQRSSTMTREEARAQVGWKGSRPLVVYTGKVGRNMKEIQSILLAAGQLSQYDFLMTGGIEAALRYYRKFCGEHSIENVTFTGFLPRYTDVAAYQKAADVLVSYYTADHHLVDYNYPQKVTEYMLSGNPIVTPRYRATQDVLNEGNAFFVAPEDPSALAQGIRRVVEDEALGERLGRQACADAQELTFEKRTRHLLTFFQTL